MRTRDLVLSILPAFEIFEDAINEGEHSLPSSSNRKGSTAHRPLSVAPLASNGCLGRGVGGCGKTHLPTPRRGSAQEAILVGDVSPQICRPFPSGKH